MAVLIRPAVVLVLGALGLAGRVRAQAAPAPEYEVKAAYLLNFTRYVEWPARAFAKPADPVVLCVLGADPFGALLERTVAGRTSQGRSIETRRVDGAAQARGCHLVFVTHAEWRRRPDVLAALARRGILTVGEGADFTEAGGVISFVHVEETVRFAVNLTAVDAAGLRISSRMLALATKLYSRTRGSSRAPMPLASPTAV